jgi:GTP cyclohydrolase I
VKGDSGAVFRAIKERAALAGVPFAANDNIANLIHEGEMPVIQRNVEKAVEALLEALCIDTDNDHNTADTARRVAKMYVREVCAGRFDPMPATTFFPNARHLNEICTLGPVAVRSMCSHHFAPITGEAWIGFIPGECVIGISKFARLTDWIMRRPQIQEEAVVQLADLLETLIKPIGLAVVVRATHNCMTWRGVEEHDTTMVNSVVRGRFSESAAARAELFSILAAQGFR